MTLPKIRFDGVGGDMADEAKLYGELAALKSKIQELSDKEAIRDLLARYGFCFDLGRYEAFYGLWTDDAVFRTDGPDGEIEMKGRERLKEVFGMEQSRYTASQHLQLEYVIKIDGDNAEAIGFQLITIHTEERPVIDRTGIRRFKFRRVGGEWRISEAVSRIMKNRSGCLDLVPEDW